MIRIMFVVTSLYMGGQEKKLLDIISNLDKSKFESEICCTKEPGPLAQVAQKNGIRIYANLLSFKFDLRILFRLISLFRKRNIQIVFTVGAGDNMFWGRLAAKLAGVPLIFSSLHRMYCKNKNRSTIGFLNKLLMPITNKVIAVGEGQRKFLEEFEKIDPTKIEVIYNGVDITLFNKNNGNNIKEELHISKDTVIIGIVATLRPEKGHSVFLESAKKIMESFKDISFIIVGDGIERCNIEKKIKELGLNKFVHMLGMRMDIPDILSDIDILVMASYPYVETFPNIVLEAMAAGKPVVATDIGCIREIVVDGETGYIVPPYDFERMADAILSVIKDTTLRKTMGNNGYHRVCEKFTLDKMVKAREDLFARYLP